jgi:hypothetical protein
MLEHLGMGGELWDISRSRPAVHGRLVSSAQSLGRTYDNEEVDYMLVDFLLAELLNAVEGVERSFEAMQAAALTARR